MTKGSPAEEKQFRGRPNLRTPIPPPLYPLHPRVLRWGPGRPGDGQRRPVFEDTIGQYVIAADGEPLRGLWYVPPEADLPLVVEASP